MSDMQDITLADADNAATGGTDNVKPKSNSLKRFLKKSKKSSVNIAAESSEGIPEADAPGKELPKGGTLSRFFTRFKGNQKSDDIEMPTCSNHDVDEEEKSVTPGKPTLKGSISTYWRTLFKRQQAAIKSDVPEVIPEEKEQTEPAAEAVAEPILEAIAQATAVQPKQVAFMEEATKQNPDVDLLPQIMGNMQKLSVSEKIAALPQPPSDPAN